MNEGRIAIITDKFAPHSGGTAVIYTHWAQILGPERAVVLTCRTKGDRAYDESHPMPVWRVPFFDIPKLRMPLLYLTFFLATPWFLLKFRPRMVVLGQMVELGALGWFWCRLFGVPYLVHGYGEDITVNSLKPLARAHLRHVMRHAAVITTLSRFVEGEMRPLAPGRDIHVLYPAVAHGQFSGGDRQAARDRLGLTDARIILTVGRLIKRKGMDQVIRAMPAILKQAPNAVYLIAGEGGDRARLERLVKELDLEHAVRFLGNRFHGDTPDLYAAADVFATVNRWDRKAGDAEGFGIVFLEASSAGLPVVAGRSGGAVEAVAGGVSGRLVDPQSVEDIAATLTALLLDDEERARLGRGGREWAARFTWEAAAERVWQLSDQPAGALETQSA